MKSYQVCVKLKEKHHNFLKELAQENDSTISKTGKQMIKEYMVNEYEDKIEPLEKNNLKIVTIERIKEEDETMVTIKLGKELHRQYKIYCDSKEISMKKMTRKIIKSAYKSCKNKNN
ncbi:hypothetical protein [Clostridium sp. ZBS18]|uniref:hypothetical protein n=1 Tax=Clostridium sp. ZBS18 TaxID=2949967 RepID=UPI002079B7EC|nr:hypothetical protein [Clostridium sp. ZBS18]